ncbi:MAG: DHHA1 domain-containing protein, partial [Cyanobacteria bacterium P01_H01_bin.119]
LADWGAALIVTCDTGSTNLQEIADINRLDIDIIVTDHHTLPENRPPVAAIINPRSLPSDHPLATLSGVAVAYKLIEALYQSLPQPQRPVETLLDLVAIGLIADLVELKGDCRYLAQQGIEKLQTQTQAAPEQATRPGIAYLLGFCKRSGDRPTDISFGIGPRINAVSRIHGDASFCVELLTSRDAARCKTLAYETELANARRKALQKDLLSQVEAQIEQVDLSTTQVLVLSDPQWPIGVLGLVAGQVAQRYGRPTILLSESLKSESEDGDRLARGSARSVGGVDLYALVKNQSHLLTSFGGHPFAAGLSLLIDHIPLFRDAINRQLRELQGAAALAQRQVLTADITVTVADLAEGQGKTLFRELKFLEPCGMGNPVPRLLLQNVWFENVWNKNISDRSGGKLRYIKTEFNLCDASTGEKFPGLWWEHYKEDVPDGRCDVIVELDFNAYQKRYEVRLLAVRPSVHQPLMRTAQLGVIDRRQSQSDDPDPSDSLTLNHCPDSWQDLNRWISRANTEQRSLTLAFEPPPKRSPQDVFKTLIGLAKYLHRTGTIATRPQLLEKLNLSDRTLEFGLQALEELNFTLDRSDEGLAISEIPPAIADVESPVVQQFLGAIAEEQFRQRYFHQVPTHILKAIAP